MKSDPFRQFGPAAGLETGGMTHDVATPLPGGCFPARAGFSTGAACIEAQASDGHENVAVADVERDPFALALFAVIEIALRGDATVDQASLAQNIRNTAGAIVAVVIKLRMSPTPFVRHRLETVPGGDGAFHGGGCVSRRIGDAIFEHRSVAGIEVIGNRSPGFHLAGAGDEAPENREQGSEQKEERFHGGKSLKFY